MLPFIDSKFFWYLFLSESKSSFLTLTASSLIMISMLSIFECITCFLGLSMKEIKVFAIINWIFYVSDFLRLFIIFFNGGFGVNRVTGLRDYGYIFHTGVGIQELFVWDIGFWDVDVIRNHYLFSYRNQESKKIATGIGILKRKLDTILIILHDAINLNWTINLY